MNNMELKEIKTSELVVDNFNVRGDEWDNDEELVDSIKSQGVLEPLLVRTIKNQKTKYPKNKTHSIICGNRRWHAAMEGRLKTVPCVIRDDIDDIHALGTSLQENLKRHSLNKIQEAEAIAKMWNMMNGTKTYEQKMKAMDDEYGLGETQVKNYLSVSEASNKLKTIFKSRGTDVDTAAAISKEKEWKEAEKIEAIKILDEEDIGWKERRNLLSEMRKRAEKETPKEALESIKKEMKGLQGVTLNVWLNAKEREATIKAAKKNSIEMETLVKRNHISWLKKEGYL